MNPSGHRTVAVAWLLVVVVLVLHQVRLWRAPEFATDVTQLLPGQADPDLEQATSRLLAATARQWIVMVGAPEWGASQRAAAEALAVLDPQRTRLQQQPALLGGAFMARLQEARSALLTSASQRWLEDATADEITQRAMQNLMQPVGDGLSSWRDDPLGLWGEWVRDRTRGTRLRPRDDWLWVEEGGLHWIALPFEEAQTGFSSWNAGALAARVATARERAMATGPGVRLVAAGTPLQAEAAASRASFEVKVIGMGALLAVILLTWVTFGSVRPILLVSLSILVGCAAALSATQLLFGRVHLLTLVFGASLIGVAEDYGIHYFAARLGTATDQRWQQLRRIAPGLWLALGTSGIAYLALGLAPFPGLRQIAVFSCVGLVAAFLTVFCWFPWLDTRPLRTTAFAAWFSRTLDGWPRWPRGRSGLLMLGAAVLLLVPGLLRLHAVDDIRLLQSSTPELLSEQREVGSMTGMASPAQVYLVSGASEEELLQNEEALTARLDALVDDGTIIGLQAASGWIPSAARQEAAHALVAQGNQHAWEAMSQTTGEQVTPSLSAPRFLSLQDLDAAPAVLPVRPWQDAAGTFHSLVMLQGVGRESLDGLAAAAGGLAGVRWIDNAARFSGVLQHYRRGLGGLLLAGTAAVLLLLHWRYGAQAWRAWLPTVLGGVITLAFFGWVGWPLQLFVVLSLILLLGMGIDYGIFMREHPGDRAVWLAVAIAGVSTLLSFGLLALSDTPALRAFGLGMLIGETSIWLLTPVFRSPQVANGTG